MTQRERELFEHLYGLVGDEVTEDTENEVMILVLTQQTAMGWEDKAASFKQPDMY